MQHYLASLKSSSELISLTRSVSNFFSPDGFVPRFFLLFSGSIGMSGRASPSIMGVSRFSFSLLSIVFCDWLINDELKNHALAGAMIIWNYYCERNDLMMRGARFNQDILHRKIGENVSIVDTNVRLQRHYSIGGLSIDLPLFFIFLQS